MDVFTAAGKSAESCGYKDKEVTNKLEINKEPDELLAEWVVRMPDKEADNLLVDKVMHEMRLRLEEKRKLGRKGWHTPNCSNEELLKDLCRNLDEGDMVDVINLAGMLLCRTSLYGKSA